jgi:putative phosphoesterase
MRHKIGIISDTHGLLRPEILEKLKDCEMILHGGDINKQSILDELGEIAPIYSVRGNNDKEWAKDLPETLQMDIYGIKLFMIHNKKHITKDMDGVNVIIFGHSHKYEEKYLDGQLWLNPGSCGPRRFTQPITMAILEIEDNGSFYVERYEIPHGNQKLGKEAEKTVLSENLRQLIETVIRDVKRGKTVTEIAKKNGIKEELAEQICRLYLTHPGVDVDGIIEKMGL